MSVTFIVPPRLLKHLQDKSKWIMVELYDQMCPHCWYAVPIVTDVARSFRGLSNPCGAFQIRVWPSAPFSGAFRARLPAFLPGSRAFACSNWPNARRRPLRLRDFHAVLLHCSSNTQIFSLLTQTFGAQPGKKQGRAVDEYPYARRWAAFEHHELMLARRGSQAS